jgi:hypothetical protein
MIAHSSLPKEDAGYQKWLVKSTKNRLGVLRIMWAEWIEWIEMMGFIQGVGEFRFQVLTKSGMNDRSRRLHTV